MTQERKEEFWEVFQSTFNTGTDWVLETIRFDDVMKEVNIQVSYVERAGYECPVCQNQNVTLQQHEIQKMGYYSFLGYKTFVHSPSIYIKCSKHGLQRIPTPWETKFKTHIRSTFA